MSDKYPLLYCITETNPAGFIRPGPNVSDRLNSNTTSNIFPR
jgi:hypothetical protein